MRIIPEELSIGDLVGFDRFLSLVCAFGGTLALLLRALRLMVLSMIYSCNINNAFH